MKCASAAIHPTCSSTQGWLGGGGLAVTLVTDVLWLSLKGLLCDNLIRNTQFCNVLWEQLELSSGELLPLVEN